MIVFFYLEVIIVSVCSTRQDSGCGSGQS